MELQLTHGLQASHQRTTQGAFGSLRLGGAPRGDKTC